MDFDKSLAAIFVATISYHLLSLMLLLTAEIFQFNALNLIKAKEM